MKYLIIIVSTVLWISQVKSQNDLSQCEEKTFSDNKISSKICWDKERRKGKAIVYNEKSEITGEWELSRMHLYSSVRISYHPNGAVKKVEYSSHPDGGIQWYRSFTGFDETGNKTSFLEESHDDLGKYKLDKPNKDELKIETTKEKEIVTERVQQDEAVYEKYYSYLWIENTTNKEIIIHYRSNSQSQYTDTVKLQPKENKKVILEFRNGDFIDPRTQYTFEFYKGTKKKKKYSLEFSPIKEEEKDVKLYEKNYYYRLVK